MENDKHLYGQVLLDAALDAVGGTLEPGQSIRVELPGYIPVSYTNCTSEPIPQLGQHQPSVSPGTQRAWGAGDMGSGHWSP